MSKFTTSAGIVLSFGLFSSFALPAYAIQTGPRTVAERFYDTQNLLTDSFSAASIPLERSEGMTEPEIQQIVAQEAVIANNATPRQNLAASYGGGGILAAARSQIGWAQDCTAMVENSLRMLGYSVGDLAPMDFVRYGVQVSPADAQPGDIMMRPGHVAIYSGGGMAVHGGVPNYGGTVEFQYSSSPYEYAIIVRV